LGGPTGREGCDRASLERFSKSWRRLGRKYGRAKMLTKSKDLFSSSTSVNPEATRNDWAARLAELFDKAEDGSDQAYWLLATVEELRDRLREIAPAVSDTKELGVALDSAAWLHNAAENIEAEFEALGDAIIRGERREDQDLRT